MGHQFEINDNEKKLLNAIGNYPETSLQELLNYTDYKWVSTVAKKIEKFRELEILSGPRTFLDFGKLCKNPIHWILCCIEFDSSYDTVISYLKLIEPLTWVFPVLSPYKRSLNVGYLSSNDAEVINLLQILKNSNIISDFNVRILRHRIILENPNFFGDPVPTLDNLLEPCEFPDISFGNHDTEWSECDIRTLFHLLGGHKSSKLIEILKKEKNVYDRKWTYEQVKYSYRKIIRNKLIERRYTLNPFSLNQCSEFILFVKTDNTDMTLRILCNFARGGRIHKEHMFCDDWGVIGCCSHSSFLIDLMYKLDQIDEIKEKELHHIRSLPHGIQYTLENTEFDYYDFDKQILEYPYDIMKEKIKGKLECELVV